MATKSTKSTKKTKEEKIKITPSKGSAMEDLGFVEGEKLLNHYIKVYVSVNCEIKNATYQIPERFKEHPYDEFILAYEYFDKEVIISNGKVYISEEPINKTKTIFFDASLTCPTMILDRFGNLHPYDENLDEFITIQQEK